MESKTVKIEDFEAIEEPMPALLTNLAEKIHDSQIRITELTDRATDLNWQDRIDDVLEDSRTKRVISAGRIAGRTALTIVRISPHVIKNTYRRSFFMDALERYTLGCFGQYPEERVAPLVWNNLDGYKDATLAKVVD